jgi:hypothetical protein
MLVSLRCHVSPPLSCSANAGHPVRRGLSVQAQPPLEYWIARSKPGDDSGERVLAVHVIARRRPNLTDNFWL